MPPRCLALFLQPATAFACGFDQVTISNTAREADRIVLGTVSDRVGLARYAYTIDVEQVIKGEDVPHRWVINDAGASDCGMPLLVKGERVVLEYYEPGRITDGPWFYAWKVEPNGTIAFSDRHQPPLPRTLRQLLAEYAAVGLVGAAAPPDTATLPDGPPEARQDRSLLLILMAAFGSIGGWRWRQRADSRG